MSASTCLLAQTPVSWCDGHLILASASICPFGVHIKQVAQRHQEVSGTPALPKEVVLSRVLEAEAEAVGFVSHFQVGEWDSY